MATLQTLGTVRLRLRLGGEDYQETLHAVQGDTGRVLEFDVLDGDGTIVTDLTGVTPVLFVRRPDGKEVGSATGEIVGGVIRITIPSSLLAYAGETKAQIQLIDSANQHKLHDHLYRLQIEESLEAGASPGENLWFSLAELTEAIAEVNLLVEQYDTDVAAVATMRDDVTSKHSEVTTMHTSLQDVFDTEEERRLAEIDRIYAETNRQTAETARANAESERATAETGRVTAEEARNAKEQERLTAELERIANELSRIDAESARATSESARASAETQRVQLYEDLLALQQMLGDEPVVELANAVTDLQQALGEHLTDFDNLEVGGRNLAPNSRDEFSFTDRIYIFSLNEELLKEYIGEFLTISFYAMADEEGQLMDAYLRDNDRAIIIDGTRLMPFEVSTEYGRFSYTIELTDISEINNLSLTFRSTSVAGGSVRGRVSIRKIQIEKGNVATDWTPALEDIDEKIGLRLKTSDLKTEIQKIDGSGSGIDADLLDGKHATDFATSTHNHDGTYALVSHNHDGTYAPTSHTHADKLSLTGGTMTGKLTAAGGDTTKQVRNIAIGTSAPSSTAGYSDGDIYLVVP